MFSTSKRRVAWLIALVGVAVIGSLAITYDRRYAAALQAVHETLEVQEAIDATLSDLKDAETGQRGFVLTGDEEFLFPYSSALRSLPGHLEHLGSVLNQDASQSASAREVRRLSRIKMDELAETIDLRRSGRTEEALAIVREGRGRRVMRAIRAETLLMISREETRLGLRERAARAARTELTVILLGVWGFFFCIVTAGLWFATRGVAEARRANDRLKASEKALRTVTDNATDLVRIIEEGGETLYVSPSCQRILGFTQEEMMAMPPVALLVPEDRELALDIARRVREDDGLDQAFVYRLRTKTGDYRWFETTYSVVPGHGGAKKQIHLTSRDITDRKRVEEERRRAERELLESEQRMRVLSEASFEGVAVSKAGIILDANENFASWVGSRREDIVGTIGLSFFPPDEHERVLEMSRSVGHYEAHLLRRDGSRFPVEVRGRDAIFRGEQVRIAVIRDITDKRRRDAELKEQAELLRSMSLRDELTGLYNRRGFLEHARQLLRNAVRARRSACLFYADLNGMKAINDTHGHEMGDRAIVATAQVLRAVFRDSDIVARLGGDEFAIFAPECGTAHVASVRQRLQEHVAELNRTGGQPFQLSVSVGESVYEPGSASDLNALMEAADRVMYEEKRSRGRAQSRTAKAAFDGPS